MRRAAIAAFRFALGAAPSAARAEAVPGASASAESARRALALDRDARRAGSRGFVASRAASRERPERAFGGERAGGEGRDRGRGGRGPGGRGGGRGPGGRGHGDAGARGAPRDRDASAARGTAKRPPKRPPPSGTARALPSRFAGLEEDGEEDATRARAGLARAGLARAGPASESPPASASSRSSSQPPAPAAAPRVVSLTAGITIAALARKLGVPAERVERTLADLGETPASDQEAIASAELVELVALELVDDAAVRVEVADADASKPSSKTSDPPRRAVVAVMGHVDHGKTTLLDTLRRTSVAATEAGGITQHVGAFVVPLFSPGDEDTKNGEENDSTHTGASSSLTFLDTPGHAAFSAMRKRGASVTDVAVLVCAADDGVMPQTLEAAAHIRAANCAFVVALTKCDAPGADPARVRDQLVASGIRLDSVPGGDVQSVEVSAKTGQGMEDLRMALSLEAEALNLTAPVEDAEALGTVLEARLDPGRGVVIHGLLRRGRLRVGDFVVAGCAYGRVRRLVGADGRDACEVKGVGPSEPFELAGLRRAPDAGDQVAFASTEARARRVADARARRREEARRGALDASLTPGTRHTQYELEHTHAPAGERGKAASRKMAVKSRLRASGVGAREGRESGLAEDELRRADAELGARAPADSEGASGYYSSTSSSVPRALCAIVKADAQGTAEAVRDSLLGLGTGAVGVRVVYLGVGPVTASDVALAAAVGGPVLAFNVREVSNEVEKLARAEGVTVVNRRVIYHLLDAAGDMLAGLAPERRVEEIAGEAEVRRVFDLSDRRGNKADIVAGCVVNRGTLDGDAKFRVVRDGRAVHEGLLDCASIRRHRSETRTVGKGGECGVSLEGFDDVRPGDQIQCVTFVMKRAKVEKVDTGGSRVVEEDSG